MSWAALCCSWWLASLCQVIILADLLPIDHMPPAVEIVRPLVLVFEVVSMLPNIKAKDGCVCLLHNCFHEWVVLIAYAHAYTSMMARVFVDEHEGLLMDAASQAGQHCEI